MTEPTLERPRQVTMAGWLIMVGSVYALALVVDRLSGLHTLESQADVRSFLAEPPGSSLGIGVDGVLSAIRTLSLVTAGCATAAGILGYQVLRRSRSARVGVTVLAVPLFLAGMVTGGFITSIVAASAAILWLQPSRSWFDGKPPPERRPAPVPVAPPYVPPAVPAAPMTVAPTAAAPVTAWPGVPVPPQAAYAARPPAVLWACLVTWISTAVVTLGLLAIAVALGLSPDSLIDEAQKSNPDLAAQGISDGMLIGATYVMIVGLIAWSVATAGLAVLVFRRVDWARIVLIVSAAAAAAICLLGAAVGAFLLVLPLIASASTIALLLRADTRPWFDRRATPTGRPSPGGPDLPR